MYSCIAVTYQIYRPSTTLTVIIVTYNWPAWVTWFWYLRVSIRTYVIQTQMAALLYWGTSLGSYQGLVIIFHWDFWWILSVIRLTGYTTTQITISLQYWKYTLSMHAQSLTVTLCVCLQSTPSLDKLIRVSQCDCRSGDIQRMETIINDKLRPAPAADNITSLTLLRVIVEAFRELSGVDLTNLLDQMASELVMCLCHCELLNTSVSISHTLSSLLLLPHIVYL